MEKTVSPGYSTLRLSGRTTRQMRAAPPGAVYVWPNGHLYYPRDLAEKENRTDLKIISAGQFTPSFVMGHRCKVVIDHAVNLSRENREALRMMMPA